MEANKMKIVILDNLIQMDTEIAGKFNMVKMIVPTNVDLELITTRAKAAGARFVEMFQG